MYENRVHMVPDRIVTISQPRIRPIVRVKAHANTEFGAKLNISMVDGYAKTEKLSFHSFNEATDFLALLRAAVRSVRISVIETLSRANMELTNAAMDLTVSWCLAGNFILCYRHYFAVHESGKEAASSFAPFFRVWRLRAPNSAFVFRGLRSELNVK